jgi:ribosome-associated translation inhibitor RaiA
MRGMGWFLAPSRLDMEKVGDGYQTPISEALRQHVEGKAPKFEETLRQIVREEVRAAG